MGRDLGVKKEKKEQNGSCDTTGWSFFPTMRCIVLAQNPKMFCERLAINKKGKETLLISFLKQHIQRQEQQRRQRLKEKQTNKCNKARANQHKAVSKRRNEPDRRERAKGPGAARLPALIPNREGRRDPNTFFFPSLLALASFSGVCLFLGPLAIRFPLSPLFSFTSSFFPFCLSAHTFPNQRALAPPFTANQPFSFDTKSTNSPKRASKMETLGPVQPV